MNSMIINRITLAAVLVAATPALHASCERAGIEFMQDADGARRRLEAGLPPVENARRVLALTSAIAQMGAGPQ